MRFSDRLLTIVITATLTSAVWIVIGSSYVDLSETGGFGVPLGAGALPDAAAPVTDTGRATSSRQPDRSASVQQGTELTIPVLGVTADQLVDTYADAREAGKRLHEAIDIMAPVGTPVLAAGSGMVERLFQSEAGGNTIYIRSDDGRTLHYYAHLQAYAPGLKEGQKIRRGQRLGTVGVTGNADPAAPHLHFAILRVSPDAEWWEPGSALNPYPFLRGG